MAASLAHPLLTCSRPFILNSCLITLHESGQMGPHAAAGCHRRGLGPSAKNSCKSLHEVTLSFLLLTQTAMPVILHAALLARARPATLQQDSGLFQRKVHSQWPAQPATDRSSLPSRSSIAAIMPGSQVASDMSQEELKDLAVVWATQHGLVSTAGCALLCYDPLPLCLSLSTTRTHQHRPLRSAATCMCLQPHTGGGSWPEGEASGHHARTHHSAAGCLPSRQLPKGSRRNAAVQHPG